MTRHKPTVIFEQVISGKDRLKKRWPELSRVADDRDKLIAAFDAVERLPALKDDPRLSRISKQTATRTLEFYNKVIADGRYVAQLHTDPGEAARKLRIKVSPKVLQVMAAIGSGLGRKRKDDNPGLVVVGGSIVVVGLAVAAAMTASQHGPGDRILIDESGRVKLGDERAKRKPGTKSKKKTKGSK